MRPYVSVLLGVWLFACLLITGCGGDSTVPLSDASKASPDDRLIGVWRVELPDGATYCHVGRLGGNAPDGVMRVVTVHHRYNGELEQSSQLLAFRSEVGGCSYLNIASLTEEQIRSLKKRWKADLLDSYIVTGGTKEERRLTSHEWWRLDKANYYTILRYQIDGDALLLWMMNKDAKKKAIEDGKMKGQIRDNTITFTDTTENLVQFVVSESDELYHDEPLRLKRVR